MHFTPSILQAPWERTRGNGEEVEERLELQKPPETETQQWLLTTCNRTVSAQGQPEPWQAQATSEAWEVAGWSSSPIFGCVAMLTEFLLP
jgi:hypothetical protein